jgi:hypothetical protein
VRFDRGERLADRDRYRCAGSARPGTCGNHQRIGQRLARATATEPLVLTNVVVTGPGRHYGVAMSFDLYVWHEDEPITAAGRGRSWSVGATAEWTCLPRTPQ